MADLRIRGADGRWHEVVGLDDGTLVAQVTQTRDFSYVRQRVTGAVSLSTPLGPRIRVLSVTALFSAAPTTSENFTATLNANEGPDYDAVLLSTDPAATSATSILWIPDEELILEPGSQLDIAYTNSDSGTIGVIISYEVL